MSGDLLSPIQDLVFKRIFGDARNADILASLLSSILQLPEGEYEHLELGDPHILPETDDGKLAILDVKVKTKSGIILDIEVQVFYVQAMRARVLYYGCDLITNQMKRGDNYARVKPVISIVIADFDLVPEESDYHNVYHIMNDKSHKIFSSLLEIHTIELQKFPLDGDRTPLADWLQFLKTQNGGEINMIAQTNPMVKKAVGILVELSADEKLREQVRAREKALHDYNSLMEDAQEFGLKRGLEEGQAIGRAEERKKWLELAEKYSIPRGEFDELARD
jgi:predicted transposase/invertase (TIGR01784 family)